MKKSSKKKPTWTDLERQRAGLDRPELLGLIHDLYAASRNNPSFLHVRFALPSGLNVSGAKATTGAGALAMTWTI
jgi:hypothetical protein